MTGKEQMEELCKELVEELRSGVIRGLGEGLAGGEKVAGVLRWTKKVSRSVIGKRDRKKEKRTGYS